MMVMMTLHVLLTSFVVLTQAQDDKCAMITTFFGSISLIDIPSTGSMTGSVLFSGKHHLNSFAPDRTNNIVYALDAPSGDLYVVDMCGNGLFRKKEGVLPGQTYGLAYNPNTGLFYVINGDDLFKIDANDNYKATLVKRYGFNFESLVFNKDFTKLYAYSNGHYPGIYTIDIQPPYTITLVGAYETYFTYSLDWENENDELKMILPTKISHELYSVDLSTNIYTNLGSYPSELSTGGQYGGVRGITMFYVPCDAVCNINTCSEYVYINDGTVRTQSEAEEFCQTTLGTSLAAISRTEELVCALDEIGNGDSPWIGLYSSYDVGFFEFIDGRPCPSEYNGRFSGLCVDPTWWLNGHPLQLCEEENGSKCVRMLADGKINNDVKCETKLNALLCNNE